MSRSPDIARDNNGRFPGDKGLANPTAKLIHYDRGEQYGPIVKPIREMRPISRRLKKTTHHGVTDDEMLLLRRRGSQPLGRIHRGLIVKHACPNREFRQQLKCMKIGDHVYLITDRHQTGAGIPGTICDLQDSTVEVVVEFTHGPKILKISNSEDIFPSNLFTHSILNLVYQTYEEIEHKYGSILNLTNEEVVAQLIQQGLAPQTACRCVDLIDEVEWHNASLPLRQWLEKIRDFYHRSCPAQKPCPSLSTLRSPVSDERELIVKFLQPSY